MPPQVLPGYRNLVDGHLHVSHLAPDAESLQVEAQNNTKISDRSVGNDGLNLLDLGIYRLRGEHEPQPFTIHDPKGLAW
jgi:hypothetical protein